MADLDREQLKRDCADALEALHRDQRVDRIAELADALRIPGAPYRFPASSCTGAAGRAGERDHMASDPGAREVGSGPVTELLG